MKRAILLLLVLTFRQPFLCVSGAPSSSAAGERLAYGHAYYLFLSGTPIGCEDCYVPLRITNGIS